MGYSKRVWEDSPSTATPITAANLNHLEQGVYDAHGAVSMLLSASRLHHFGHSLAAGGGASGPDRDSITRLAAALKTREVMSSKGGAVLHWNNVDPDASGNGGYNTVGQQTRGIKRAHGLVRTATSVNATSVPVGAATDGSWAPGDLVHVGTGTNGETAYVVTVTGTSPTQTLNLDRQLTSAHAVNEPVFVVPHAYETLNPLYLLWFGLNDVMASGTGSGGTGGAVESVGERAFKEAYRAALGKLLSAEYYDANHSSTSRSSQAATAGAAGVGMGSFFRAAFTLNDVMRIDVPANFAGGDIYVYFVSVATQGAVHTFTLDGAAQGTLDTRNAHFTGKWNVFAKIFRGVSAGRHVIEATTTTGGGNSYFTGWSIGAEVPPIVICPGFNRPYDYDVWPNWTYGNARGTVNASHGAGSTSFTITAPLSPAGAAATLKRGELITFDPGGANEETLEIAADAGGTTVTTTTPSTKPHNTGQTYQGNVHDQAILQRCHGWVPAILAEGFPSSCLHVDVDAALDKNVKNFVQSNTAGLTDGAHFSDYGHGVVAQAILDELRSSTAVAENLAAQVSVPVAPLPDPIYFLGPLATAGAASTIGASGAIAEAFPNSRHRRDLRRAVEARLQLNLGGNANPGQRGRVEYSLDGGSTWKTLGKKPTWADTAIGTANEVGQVDLTATGYKDTGWFPLPAEVWGVTDVLLRYVHGNRTSGTTVPTYFFITIEFR